MWPWNTKKNVQRLYHRLYKNAWLSVCKIRKMFSVRAQPYINEDFQIKPMDTSKLVNYLSTTEDRPVG